MPGEATHSVNVICDFAKYHDRTSFWTATNNHGVYYNNPMISNVHFKERDVHLYLYLYLYTIVAKLPHVLQRVPRTLVPL